MRRPDREGRLRALEAAFKITKIPSLYIQLLGGGCPVVERIENESDSAWLTRVVDAGNAVLELRLFEKNRFHCREHPRGVDVVPGNDPGATWAAAQGIDTGKPAAR